MRRSYPEMHRSDFRNGSRFPPHIHLEGHVCSLESSVTMKSLASLLFVVAIYKQWNLRRLHVQMMPFHLIYTLHHICTCDTSVHIQIHICNMYIYIHISTQLHICSVRNVLMYKNLSKESIVLISTVCKLLQNKEFVWSSSWVSRRELNPWNVSSVKSVFVTHGRSLRSHLVMLMKWAKQALR